jgi:diaminopimelate epimerase
LIGGDGLILLEMIRNLILKWCITTQMEVKAHVWKRRKMFGGFRQKLKTIGNSATFNAVDGLHHATIKDDGIVTAND